MYAALRIDEVLKTEVSVHDPENPVTAYEAQTKGTVEFDHVSFAYPEAGENVLTDISFKAEKGETVAVIGSTGSGKSTLINLIPTISMMQQKDAVKSRRCGCPGNDAEGCP